MAREKKGGGNERGTAKCAPPLRSSLPRNGAEVPRVLWGCCAGASRRGRGMRPAGVGIFGVAALLANRRGGLQAAFKRISSSRVNNFPTPSTPISSLCLSVNPDVNPHTPQNRPIRNCCALLFLPSSARPPPACPRAPPEESIPLPPDYRAPAPAPPAPRPHAHP